MRLQRGRRLQRQRLSGVILAEVDRFSDVGVGLGKRLADLKADQRRRFVALPALWAS